MFASLTEKLTGALRNLRGAGKLTEENMAAALQEVRTALLAADVHFRVVRDFIDRVQLQCVGQEVLKGVAPGQQVIKVIHDELVRLLGEGSTGLTATRPLKVLLVGLHGSGKTTSTAKLGRLLRRRGGKPFVIGADIYRPAAIDQLEILARQEELGFYADRQSRDVPAIGAAGLDAARAAGADCILFDTAGRLQIDAELMAELQEISAAVEPHEILLVADGMTGQAAVDVAQGFDKALEIDGLILTKLDGDARGGAALSMRAVTGRPIKFIGIGEKLDGLEVFHPERMASRILGMGDVLTLIEKATKEVSVEDSLELAQKMKRNEFGLDDFLKQLQMIRRMGSISSIAGMIPGMNKLMKNVDPEQAERETKRIEAIIFSMTPAERRQPGLLNGSRRKRIARGSGTSVEEVNRLMKQFLEMKKMMGNLSRLGLGGLMKGKGGGGLGGLGDLFKMMK